MRRGRQWSSGGGNAEHRFHGGGRGAGFGPRGRGFFSRGPPRINRPPWPTAVGPPHARHGPPSDNFYENERHDNFGQRNFQNNSNRGFHHGPPRSFQRGGQHNTRIDHRNSNPLMLDRPPPLFNKSSAQFNQLHPAPPRLDLTNFECESGDNEHFNDRTEVEDYDKTNINMENVNAKFEANQDSRNSDNGAMSYQPPDHNHSKSAISCPPVFKKFPHRDGSHQQMFQRSQQKFRPKMPLPSDYSQRRPNLYQQDQRPNKHLDFPQSQQLCDKRDSHNYSSGEFIQKQNRSLDVWDTNPLSFPAPTIEFSGQRPPATDHYIDSSGAVDDCFNKSIGDTVDIIKKRLQNRQENPTQQRLSIDTDDTHWDETDSPEKIEKSNRSRSRRDSHHSHRRSKSEKKCARMKKKIVRELFKMDKSALHKFVDDPQSSAKFEFALNSLITESRNSLNRQMRAAAEKSLNGNISRLDHRDKDDTVYEDTFMAQMQGVLDPCDIVMLSDIKPMVMAEINKVLQVDEYSHCSFSEDGNKHNSRKHLDSYDSSDPLEVPLDSGPIDIDDESMEEGLYVSDEEKKLQLLSRENRNRVLQSPEDHSRVLQSPEHHSRGQHSPDRRSREQYSPQFLSREQYSTECHSRERLDPDRHSCERNNQEQLFSDDNSRSKFPDNFDTVSDDEYTFAELDNQYHVAVEYSMIEQARMSPTQQNLEKEKVKKCNTVLPVISLHSDEKLDLRTPSSLPAKYGKLNLSHSSDEQKSNNNSSSNAISSSIKDKARNEPQIAESVMSTISEEKNDNKSIKLERKESPSKKHFDHKSQKESFQQKVEVASNPTHKRESGDKISHRKEKKKKTETKCESNKVLNKNIIINVNDCTSKSSEKCDTGAKSVFNLYFSKSGTDKARDETTRAELMNIAYSDKYVKRKTSTDKIEKDCIPIDTKKTLSAPKTPTKENTNINTPCVKSESKAKLLPINMFEQTPKKSSSHTFMRNTAILSPEPKPNEIDDNAVKLSAPIAVKKGGGIKMVKKAKTLITSYTQTVVKHTTHSTQTKDQAKKTVTVDCQTDATGECITKQNPVKSEDVLERMKQIDMEIQHLILEKFKLYKNLENGAQEDTNMQSLGMAIVNMNTESLCTENADDSGLLDTFTKMSEEELQEIALQDINDTTLEETFELATKSKKKKIHQTKKAVVSKKISMGTSKKKKNIPKVVLKLNKNRQSSSSESHDEYKVVKLPKKQKKVTFQDEVLSAKEIRRKAYKASMTAIEKLHKTGKDEKFVSAIKPKKKHMKVTKRRVKMTKKEHENLKRTVRECSIIINKSIFSDNLLEQFALTTFSIDDGQPKSEEKVFGEKLKIGEEQTVDKLLDTESDEIESDLLQDIILEDFGGVQLQDDMLDVSEDIVIGDIGVSADPSIVDQECDVVDNGSSVESTTAASPAEGCKLYDFSPNGELGTDIVALQGHADAVVAMETINDDILAACLDGNVYHYSGRDGRLLATLRGSNFALTCLTVVADKYGTTVYTGCLDSRIRYYDLDKGLEKGPECNVLSPIQSMDRAWDTIFVGTRTGFVLQFECKNNLLIPVSSLKFSDQTILALRALKEGPRKVLLIASRSDQVTVKDAQTGLLLRTLEGPKMTVYSLLYEDGRVYCGTNTSQIQVYDFTSGALSNTHTSGKGAVCLRAAGGLLLAGCYDGCVYVYAQNRAAPLAQLRGPNDMLLSLALLPSRIIASYKNKSVHIWKIPTNIMQEMVL